MAKEFCIGNLEQGKWRGGLGILSSENENQVIILKKIYIKETD